nr:retrotransposon protein, putative, Ty1-copia subclass [Tanacetum cinerariifolium]
MQNVPYASAVGSIMYAVRCTRPDVAFAQNITSRFQQNPGDIHWTTVKNILEYHRNTKDMFLVYIGDLKRELRVSCYTDTGYLTDADDLKSQTGYVFVLNGGAVDWNSAKQSIFATSFAEVEYIAAFDAFKEPVWVRKFISGLRVVPTIKEPISMYCDNTGAIAIANESGITKGARHFYAKVHYLREVIKFGDIKLKKVHTDDNLVDPFTKALAFPKHSEHTKNIGMLPASSLIMCLTGSQSQPFILLEKRGIASLAFGSSGDRVWRRASADHMCLYIDDEEHELGDLGEPANYKAALLDPKSEKWLKAMNVEIQSMKDNEVWVSVELPPNGKTVGSKWLFKKKTDIDGVVHTYKARLVAKGYTQTSGIDYEKTFSPVADIRAIRILIAITTYYDYEIWQMDVKTAFLNGYLNEEVYMEQPEGFVNPKYPNRRYCMENSKRGSIPMQEKLKLSKSQSASTHAEMKRMQNTPYASAMGSIMYVVRCTHLNVAFAQNVTSRFQQNPGDLYWTTVKNILKYLMNTKDMFLVYGGDLRRELKISCYTDTGYLTDADDLKSQTGYVKPYGLENSFLGLVLFPQLKNP